MKIPFNKPYLTGNELKYIQEAVDLGKISGNGEFTQRCQGFFEQRYGFQKCLLTTSCTDALEMAAILLDIKLGDEVILPSYTFVSTANAFVLRGAKIVFVDSKQDHPNLDETLLEDLITSKTKIILVVHYGGIACEMDTIMALANKHNIYVVEDAAQAVDSFYKGKALGGIGHLGCFSFHETKNIQCGEGGMLVINDRAFVKRAEIIWEKGTDRAAFFRGEVDKYGWVDLGSSFLPSEVTTAFLWAQLENIDAIQARREGIWEDYFSHFNETSSKPKILSPYYLSKFTSSSSQFSVSSPESYSEESMESKLLAIQTNSANCLMPAGNWHLFYLLFPDLESRMEYVRHLNENGILAVFHYQSLHRSTYAQKHFPEQHSRNLLNSDRFSDCLLRLPMFYELPDVS
jgi:dTDP-4-amino-4,6-dideoxygalactose transaminase